ncbi:MAG: DNRLRE domain-containing protein, partial [Oscillospiraceae bacterium]|nr:DNRLRE domain-containing protein [Oscillospiraceae bacterium]
MELKRIKSICSVLMVIVMMLSLFPGDVYATNEATDCVLDDEKLSVTESEVLSEFESGNGPTVLYEDVSRRGRYEKHFVLSDGSYQAVVYTEPIHYATASGWEEVDNTLSLQDDLDGGKRYVTVDGLADVSFASSANDRLVTVKHDGYELSWNVRAVTSGKLTSEIATAELISLDRLDDEDKSAYLAERSSSAIRYRDALGKGADLEYVVLPSRVKENIILNSQQDIASYVITVYVDGLSARLLKDRRVEFVDQDGDVIFMMTSPYMYDSAGELSENISVELSSSGRGVYVIRMTPDVTWLNDASRVYPITIDPQVTTSTAQTNIVDNYVLEGAGNQNGNLDRVYIGRKSGTRARAYIKFTNMPTLPTGATVTAASMTTHIVANTSTGNTADAYMVMGGDWSASTITWANMPSAYGTLATSISHNSLTRYTFSCTYAVQTWYSGSSVGQNKNYGIMLRYHDESIADYNAVYSADHTTASQRPSIVIT